MSQSEHDLPLAQKEIEYLEEKIQMLNYEIKILQNNLRYYINKEKEDSHVANS